MSLTGTIKTLFSDERKTEMIFPRTKIKAISNTDGSQTLEEILAELEARWAGAWIEFTDENGDMTDEPYIHWLGSDDGMISTLGLPKAEEGEF